MTEPTEEQWKIIQEKLPQIIVAELALADHIAEISTMFSNTSTESQYRDHIWDYRALVAKHIRVCNHYLAYQRLTAEDRNWFETIKSRLENTLRSLETV